MGNKQTAVQWLVEKITKNHDKSFTEFYRAEIQESMQIERQQIERAHQKGVYCGQDIASHFNPEFKNASDYYIQTFKP